MLPKTKNTQLVVFGDSWVTGAGLGQPPNEVSPHAFGSQLSVLLGSSQFVNCGIEGSSNSRTVLQLLNYTKNYQNLDSHTAIFFITTPARSCVISRDDNTVIDLPCHDNTMLCKTYLEYFSSCEQLNFECFKNILAMQQICKHYEINDYYISGWSDLDLEFPGIDQSKFYPKTCAQLIGYKTTDDFIKLPRNEYVVDDSKHPSIAGHRIIAQALYDFIH
jgi:hypothetical protein